MPARGIVLPKYRAMRVSARPSTVGMPLRDYLSLSDDELRVLFRNSPIKRIKRRGFLRNVCVALGNVGDSSDLSALERASRFRTVNRGPREMGDSPNSVSTRNQPVPLGDKTIQGDRN
jgi:epoxyqueuosine reductase QueG